MRRRDFYFEDEQGVVHRVALRPDVRLDLKDSVDLVALRYFHGEYLRVHFTGETGMATCLECVACGGVYD